MDEVARYACSIDVSMDEKYYFSDDKGVLQSADNLISYSNFVFIQIFGELHFLKDEGDYDYYWSFSDASIHHFFKKIHRAPYPVSQGGVKSKRVYISPADWNNCLSGGYM